ncbi:hypothetical protein [Tautonia marina]|uniref:hypothetical protein n=1 Tax=Tautonia marina TaxID=2653855 RepID=UPI00126056AB|nr:hypothetical protein [Tautonia marina]
MTSHPLDLDAARCRLVLNDLSGEEMVAVAEHALDQWLWCDEFCVLVGLKNPLIWEVRPIFERGLRTLGLECPSRKQALIGVGCWRSMQVLDRMTSPALAAWSLRQIAGKHWSDCDPLLPFVSLDEDRQSAEGEHWRTVQARSDRAIVEEAQRFLRDHSHAFPQP